MIISVSSSNTAIGDFISLFVTNDFDLTSYFNDTYAATLRHFILEESCSHLSTKLALQSLQVSSAIRYQLLEKELLSFLAMKNKYLAN